MIMVRTLRRDIAKYNTDDSVNIEDTLEETGWKLVHGDVFRPPRHPRLFAAVIGSGIQIFFMAMITISKYIYRFVQGSNLLKVHHFSYRHAGNAVSIVARCPDDGWNHAVRVHGFDRWLFLRPFVQNHEGKKLGASSFPDGDFVPRTRVRHMLHFKLLHLGSQFEWCRSFWHNGGTFVFMVWNLIAPGVPRILLWI